MQRKVSKYFLKAGKYALKHPLKGEVNLEQSGFGGLEVACWPLVPKFAGSNPAEAVGFFGFTSPPKEGK
jgi:hypothetical protein